MTTLGQVFAEAYRLHWMRGLETTLQDAGYTRIAGVDEVGRGSLAGPVVAAAVLVEGDVLVPGVDDSKHVKAERRELMAAAIRQAHPVHAVVAVSAADIDGSNILRATEHAMQLAISRLQPAPEMTLIDAVRLPRKLGPTLSIIRGDQVSYAIACASILAKVARDRTMVELGRHYPHYRFAAHKGYGAAVHRQALNDYGPSPEHRLTFKSVLPRATSAPGRRGAA